MLDNNPNVKDLKILEELDKNPKISITKLAKNVRLSQQVVDYRIKKLESDGVINHFGTIINLAKLGYQQYRILLQLSKYSEKQKSEIINYLQNKEGVYWTAIIGGKWDLLIALWVKNYQEFEDFLSNLFNEFPEILSDYDAVNIIKQEFYNHKFLNEKTTTKNIEMNLSNINDFKKISLLDEKILKNISDNCRLSSLQIANQCKTNYKTVQNHIKKLEDDKIISGYRTFLSSDKYEFKAYFILISFKNYGAETEKKLFSYALNNKIITQSIKLFGKWSIMFLIRAKNQEEVQKLIIDIRNKHSGIGEYEIIPIFKDLSINHFPIKKE